MSTYEVEVHAEWSRADTARGDVRAFRPAVRKALETHANARDINITVTKQPESDWLDGSAAGTISFTTDVEAKNQAEAVDAAVRLFKAATKKKGWGRREIDPATGMRESYTAMERRINAAPGVAWCRGPHITVV